MPTSTLSGPTTSSAVAIFPAGDRVTTAGVDASQADAYIDRRAACGSPIDRERRQFTNSHSELSPAASELAAAVDQYKMRHRRRFINYEEMLSIVRSLGYQKP